MSSEIGKIMSAEHAIQEFVKMTTSPYIIGIGSGSTIIYAVEFLAKRYRSENLNIKCIPSSFQAKQLIVANGLPLGDLEVYPQLDIYIDGADEIDDQLNLIKGGGACLTMEKIVAHNSKIFVVIADQSKRSKYLGENWEKGIPIEVIPASYVSIIGELKTFGYNAKLRYGVNKAGPVVTDTGGFIIDAQFNSITQRNWLIEHSKIKMIPGVVETGLFINMAHYVIFGESEGTAYSLARQSTIISTPPHG